MIIDAWESDNSCQKRYAKKSPMYQLIENMVLFSCIYVKHIPNDGYVTKKSISTKEH